MPNGRKTSPGLIQRAMEVEAAKRERANFTRDQGAEQAYGRRRTGNVETRTRLGSAHEAMARQQDYLAGRDVAAGIVARRKSRTGA